jgi:protein SFI1
LPTNALFKAYDRILPNYGIDPEHDHHLSRLVFRVGGERGTDNLLSKFRAVLRRMDIELVLESVNISAKLVQEGGLTLPPPTDDSAVIDLPLGQYSSPRQHVIQNDNDRRHRRRMELLLFPESIVLAEQEQIDANQHGCGSSAEDFSGHSIGSDELSLTMSNTEHRRRSPQSILESDQFPVASDTTFHTVDVLGPPFRQSIPGSGIASPLKAMIESPLMASGFRAWKSFASAARLKQVTVDGIALDYRSQERIGKIAQRTFELHKLSCVVSHWVGLALSGVRQTQVARRHILRLRYFGILENVSMATKVKISQFQCRTLFDKWHNRTSSRREYDMLVSQMFNRVLSNDAFTSWHDVLLHRKAALYYSTTTKRASLNLWSHHIRFAMHQLHHYGKHNIKQSLIHQAFTKWLAYSKCRVVESRHLGKAALARHSGVVLWRWNNHSATLRMIKVMRMSNSSCQMQSSIIRWRDRACRGGDCAYKIYQSRALSLRLHAWQLHAKASHFAEGNNLRALSDSVYGWRIASRIMILQRMQDQQRKMQAMFGMLNLVKATRQHQLDSQLQSCRYVAQLQMNKVLSYSHIQQTEYETWHTTALAFLSSSRQLNALVYWLQGASRQDQGRMKWASRAAFYMNATAGLKAWIKCSKFKNRKLLRASYRNFRLDKKHRLASSYLRAWSSSTMLQQMSRERCHQTVIKKGEKLVTKALLDWESRLMHSYELDAQSVGYIQMTYLSQWKVFLWYFQDSEAHAKQRWAKQVLRSHWDKWAIKSLLLKGRQHTSADVREKNARLLLRRSMRSWTLCCGGHDGHSSTSEPRFTSYLGSRDKPQSISRWQPRHSSFQPRWSRPEHQALQRRHVLDFVAADTGSELNTPNTPTRWTGFARSVAPISSTTPSAPLLTPFERELRQQYRTRVDLNVPSSLFTTKILSRGSGHRDEDNENEPS